jgi:hypothetical protein
MLLEALFLVLLLTDIPCGCTFPWQIRVQVYKAHLSQNTIEQLVVLIKLDT